MPRATPADIESPSLPSTRIKACEACAKIKIRCEPGLGRKCTRCRRLGKPCVMQKPGTHSRLQGDRHHNVQTNEMQRTLDRVVALLSAERPSTARSSAAETPPHAATLHHLHEIDYPLPDVTEFLTCMHTFSTEFAPLFPFVVLPSDTVPERLAAEKPFLYLAISMVACKVGSRQRRLAQAARQYISEHVIINGEVSLDLLQGLLVHTAWHHTVMLTKRLSLDMMIHLVLGQLTGLGLNQNPASSEFPNYLKELNIGPPQSPRTLEERRAYLGCYYLTSMYGSAPQPLSLMLCAGVFYEELTAVRISTCVHSVEAVRTTKYTHQCCDELQKAAEYATDVDVIQLVRSCHVADRIHQTFSREGHFLGPLPLPLSVGIQWYGAEIQTLKASLPVVALPSSPVTFIHYHLEIMLYRVALTDGLADAQNIGPGASSRLDLLYALLESVRAFFANFRDVPAALVPRLPHPYWIQFAHALMILSSLSTHRPAGGAVWDADQVSGIVDYYDVVDILGQKFAEAKAQMEEEQAESGTNQQQGDVDLPWIFRFVAMRLEHLKAYHRKRKEDMEQGLSQLDMNLFLAVMQQYEDALQLGGPM